MPPRFFLKYFDPPPAIERHVPALFHYFSDAPLIEDCQPGALGQLVFFPRHGGGEVEFDGVAHPIIGGAHLLCGFSRVVPFRFNGPWHAVGASLSPLGWAALTGQAACDHFDRFMPADELLGDEVCETAEDINSRYRDGTLDGRAACAELAEWIAPRLSPIPQAHEKLYDSVLGWLGESLNPRVEDLFPRLSYSRRQGERLVERYFGLPPATLARKYRAVRASAMLSQPDLSETAEALIAEAFHDQPHMIREIRRYCGRTPSRLGGGADPLLQTLLQMHNFRRLHLLDGLE